VALDLLRGFFLAVMIIDHLRLFPNIFEVFSGRGDLWMSAAEGFFIISGILVGYVYGPRMQQNAGAALKKIMRRAARLYAWAVLLTWLFVWWGHQVGAGRVKPGLWLHPPIGDFLYKTLTLQYSYGWADFLQYYVIFLLAAPLVLWLCVRRKAWLVVAASVALWLARGLSFNRAWQILFVGGMVAGYYLPQMEQTVRAWPVVVQRRTRKLLYGSAAGLLGLSVLTVRTSSDYVVRLGLSRPSAVSVWGQLMLRLDHFHTISKPWLDKWSMAPLRLMAVVVIFTALYVAVRRREQFINRVTRGFLQVLGQNSLFVYGLHAVVVFSVQLVLSNTVGLVLDSLYTGLALAGLYVVTRYYPYALRSIKLTVRRVERRQLQAEKA
jgi:hypothetical protein